MSKLYTYARKVPYLTNMQFRSYPARGFSPITILVTIFSIFPPLALASNCPRKGENYKWPDPQTFNTTSMTPGQCTLTNLMAIPVYIGDKLSSQKSSLIIYDSKCTEIGRQGDVLQRDKDIAIHSTLPKMVTIGKSTGWDVHHQQIKACSAQFNCTAAADSAAVVNSLDLDVFLVGVLALAVAATILAAMKSELSSGIKQEATDNTADAKSVHVSRRSRIMPVASSS
ncbi:uncharacterized protein Bfra_007831 [Botrytis fragariae]|uniref:Uncharacterized protein n=1 Tax=Botrytis fragariae TaxID=1964551 RepID=A0A8H6AQ42_9HELO|nr:uncharacterized protein Bfra_007831 [Botrytis fragariae]KAF5871315.1 hypothetical protein Bfra_007831 [Botrytis fragariae]